MGDNYFESRSCGHCRVIHQLRRELNGVSSYMGRVVRLEDQLLILDDQEGGDVVSIFVDDALRKIPALSVALVSVCRLVNGNLLAVLIVDSH